MEGHLTMSKKERARLVVMAKVMKSGMKIIEALRGGSRDAATVADRGRLWQKWRRRKAHRWGWIERYSIPKALYVDFKNVYITTREPTLGRLSVQRTSKNQGYDKVKCT